MATFAERQTEAEEAIRQALAHLPAADILTIMNLVDEATGAASQHGYDVGYRNGQNDAYFNDRDDID